MDIKYKKEPQSGDIVTSNILKLRDSLQARGFFADGCPKNADIAEIIFKINSCLYKEKVDF
jgi:hypothetical protein